VHVSKRVAQARPRHVMSLSNGAARVFELPRLHDVVRTGDGAALPMMSKVARARPRAARVFELPRLHDVVRTGDGAALPITYKGSAGASRAASSVRTARLHDVVRTGDGAALPMMSKVARRARLSLSKPLASVSFGWGFGHCLLERSTLK